MECAAALQARLWFTFIRQPHRKSVPLLAKQNSRTAYEHYVSVLTDCRWMLSFLTAEDKRFFYF